MQESILRYSNVNGMLVPHLMDQRDHPWLGELLNAYRRFKNSPRRKLKEYLQGPLPFTSPEGKTRLAIYTLNKMTKHYSKAPVPPTVVRSALFTEAAKREAPNREEVFDQVAKQLNLTSDDLDKAMFADLPGEQVLIGPPEDLTVEELSLRSNLALIQGLLFRAVSIRVEIFGKSRPVIRHAKLKGLICSVTTKGTKTTIEISGPYSLFRHTLVYGRAISELVPILAWCNHFEMTAKCHLRNEMLLLKVRSGDPIFPRIAPKPFDSRLEERFEQEFSRLTPDWDLIREPIPIAVGSSHIFPDFAIQNRLGERWLLEIIGFWTPEYIHKKLTSFREAKLSNLILCINQKHNCSETSLPPNAKIVYYKRKIDPVKVLKLIEKKGKDHGKSS